MPKTCFYWIVAFEYSPCDHHESLCEPRSPHARQARTQTKTWKATREVPTRAEPKHKSSKTGYFFGVKYTYTVFKCSGSSNGPRMLCGTFMSDAARHFAQSAPHSFSMPPLTNTSEARKNI